MTKDYAMWMGPPGKVTIPAVVDFDGDGDEDATVYRDGAWRFYNESGSLLKSTWVQNVAGQYPLPIVSVKPLLP